MLESEFINYVSNFMDKFSLWPLSGKAVVAVSGGHDSMSLLYVFANFLRKNKLKNLEAIYIDHGTRKESAIEIDLISAFCDEFNIKFRVKKISDLSFDFSNFEFKAREERYHLLYKCLGKGDSLYTAHHINDSYEWSLMQMSKSSSLKGQLGIPVVSNRVIRPFLCITREQLEIFSRKSGIPFLYDKSNGFLKFERNFVRKKIIPNIKEKYPKYLKQYVYRSNELARQLGLHRGQSRKPDYIVLNDFCGGVSLQNLNQSDSFDGAQEQIIKIILKLSTTKRGVLREQVERLINCKKNGKIGPLLFSGEVLGFSFYGQLYFISRKGFKKLEVYDEKVLSWLKLEHSQIPKPFNKSKNPPNFPYINFYNQKLLGTKKLKSLNSIWPLLPKSTDYALSHGIGFQYQARIVNFLQNTKYISDVSCFYLESWPPKD